MPLKTRFLKPIQAYDGSPLGGHWAYKRLGLQGDSLVVYLPDRDPSEASKLLGELFGSFPGHLEKLAQWRTANAHYCKMMRFTLVDEGARLFVVHRWCFRGSIDDWTWLSPPALLHDLIEAYAPHLGKESFFDLM